MTTASNKCGTVTYVRGPWVLAFILWETDQLYGDALRRLDDSSGK